MPLEIEHKFLVSSDAWRADVVRATPMAQGYLCADGGRIVRVRVAGDAAFLTVKGPASPAADGSGAFARPEYEFPIPVPDAREMLGTLAMGPVILKTRHEAPARGGPPGLFWEIDVFEGDNAGLIVAEIELPALDTPFDRPGWLGREVTAEARYRNSALSRRPFKDWSPEERAGAHGAARATGKPRG